MCAFYRTNDSSGPFHSYRRELTFESDKLMKSLVVAQFLGSVNFELLGFFLDEFSLTVELVSLMEVASLGSQDKHS